MFRLPSATGHHREAHQRRCIHPLVGACAGEGARGSAAISLPWPIALLPSLAYNVFLVDFIGAVE
jgi:hypothetical protein